VSEVKDILTSTDLPILTVGQKGGRGVASYNGRDEMLVQVDCTVGGGAISYTIEGRIDKRYNWTTIAGPYTASTIVPIATVPEIQINVGSISGGARIDRAGVITR
jgi:hypothetical protein